MCDKEDENMIREKDIESIHNRIIPDNRKKHIIKAFNEVELMEKGILPKKTARQLLKELKEE
jgi:hypothetical protein